MNAQLRPANPASRRSLACNTASASARKIDPSYPPGTETEISGARFHRAGHVINVPHVQKTTVISAPVPIIPRAGRNEVEPDSSEFGAGPVFWPMLTVSWLLTTGSLRAFQTTFVHHTSHGNLSGKPRMDRIPAVVIPGIWLYQVSGLFQVMTKHTWVRDTSGRLGAREVFVRLTYGRFIGCRTPESNLPWFRGIGEWSIWTIRMLGIYLPFRCFASASAAHVKTKKFRASLRSLLLDGLVPSASYEKQLTCSAAGSCPDWLNSGGGSPGPCPESPGRSSADRQTARGERCCPNRRRG